MRPRLSFEDVRRALIAAMLVVRWFRPAPFIMALGRTPRWLRQRGQVVLVTTGLTLAIAMGSLAVLWAGYGFRFSGLHPNATPSEEYYFSWDVILDKKPLPLPTTTLEALLADRVPFQESKMSRLIDSLRQKHLLPEAYLWGFAHTYKFSRYRPAYFMGEHRTTGWRLFFPVALVLKTTVPALLLFLAAVAALLAARARQPKGSGFKPWLYRATPLLLFFVVYWAMAITMNLNIGHRHILPTYPIFYVLAGAAVLWLFSTSRRIAGAAITIALLLHAVDSLTARPFYLSYFQPLAGGMDRGHRYLVDSSYDWGQGLPELKRWLHAKEEAGDKTPVYLTYFGADSPEARGIKTTRFGDGMMSSSLRFYPAQIGPGWYVISATHLRRVYFPGRGPWTERHETLYRTLLERLRRAQAKTDPRTEGENIQLQSDATDYEELQFCRLAYFLENRAPHEVVGGSLLVFRLGREDVKTALYAPRAEMERRRAGR